MKTVFLTGGSGFVGRNFIEQASGRFQLIAPRRSELNLSNLIEVEKYFEFKKFDVVVHAACEGVLKKEPAHGEYFNANIKSFDHLWAQRSKFKKFIYLSSGAAYGRPLIHGQIQESEFDKKQPDDQYGLAKYLIAKKLEKQKSEFSDTTCLNLFGVFGPYEDYKNRFISYAIVQSLQNKPIIIKQNVNFDYLYVNDLVRILERFIDCESSSPYSHINVGSGTVCSLENIATVVRDEFKSKSDIQILENTLAPEYSPNTDRLAEFLGKDFHFTPLRTAIRELGDWYIKQLRLPS